MQIPFTSGSYSGKSKVADPRECINLYMEKALHGGDNALCDFPGLVRKQVVPSVKPTYGEDYDNLTDFHGDYERPDGVTLTLTSTVAASATGSHNLTGVLSGLSSTDGDELYYADMELSLYSFAPRLQYEGTCTITATAATSSQSYSQAADFSAGTKLVRLEKPGTAYAVTGISTVNKTFTVAGDHTAEFYPGLDIHLKDHSVLGTMVYSVLQSVVSGENTVVYVNEPVTDTTVDGTINPVQVCGVAYADQYRVRSLDVPRPTSVTSITENRKYLVVGNGYTVTYNETEYSEGETFTGVSGETEFTDSGTGAVVEYSSVDYFDWLGYKTKAEDQAAALIAACTNNDSSSADLYANALLEMQYPLADAGDHSADTGNIATIYHTLGYSTASGATKAMAVKPHFRVIPAMWAAISLGFYAQKYPTGTYVTEAKAALVLLLDHWIDNYLVTTADSLHQWLFRDGKGIFDRMEPRKSFTSGFLPKHCTLEGNALAWCALTIANDLSLATASTVLTGLSYTYLSLANQMKTKLAGNVENNGFWHPLKRRPIQAYCGLNVLEIDADAKTITVDSFTEYVLRSGDEITLESHSDTDNNGTYTVESVDNYSTSAASGSIANGTVYKVVGTIVYNSVTLHGTVADPVYFRGVSGVTTYTGTAVVSKMESIITVAETISADMAYSVAGDGVVIFQNKYITLSGLAAFIFFATQAGYDSLATSAKSILSQFNESDASYPTLTGYVPYAATLSDTFLDDTEYFSLSSHIVSSNAVQPWSTYVTPGIPDGVSALHTFLAMTAFAAAGDYALFKTTLDEFYAVRTEVAAYPHTTFEYLDFSTRTVHYYAATPKHQYPVMQSWAAVGDIAWSVIAQKPNGLFGIQDIGLSISGRSSSNSVRGLCRMDDYLYAVIGNICVRFDEDLVAEIVSTSVMDTDEGTVTLMHNGVELMITDGTTKAYVYNSGTSAWTTLTRAINTFYGGLSGAVMDGYFISGDPQSYNFYHSNLNAGSTWDITDQSAADYKPDKFVALAAVFNELWIFCEETSEIFYNSGSANLVFQRRSGGTLDVGCAASHSVVEIDNSLVWLASDLTVRRASGISPQIISSPQMSYHMEEYDTVSDAFAFGYTISGRKFYQLTFPSANVTWVYDFSTSNWSKKASFQTHTDFDGRHRASSYAYFNGMHLVGDYEDGVIYQMMDGVYTDDEHRKIRTVIAPSLRDREDGRNLFISCLELPMEVGVGIQSGQGEEPQAMLQYSDDGGKTWSNERWKTIGKTGEYKNRVRWNRLGSARNKVFKFQFSDPVPITIIGNPIINPR
jgi:hypothetical protein